MLASRTEMRHLIETEEPPLMYHGAGSGARTRDLRMSQTPQGACTSYDCLGGCPMSPTRYQLRHPGLNRG